MSTSTQLADHILSGFAGPRAFIKYVEAPQPEPLPKKPSKFSPFRNDIDEGLRRLCNERKPNQTFTQKEIADAVGCDRKLIQYIEKKAFYKFVRRLIEIDPEIAEQSLGDLVTMEDVLRIHHPSAHKQSNRVDGDTDLRFRARRARKVTAEYSGPHLKNVESLEQVIKKISAQSNHRTRSYGHKPSDAQLAEIRAERMRRQKEASGVL